MRLLNSKKTGRRMNRKGDISLYFILIGALIFAITFLFYMGKMEGNLQKVGESTIKVVNTFEMSERLFFYVDASTELAAKSAAAEVTADSGYLQETFKGKIVNSGCGTLAYPIIDSDKVINSPNGINECFPNYEDEFKIIFTRNLNRMLLNYDPFALDPTNFKTTITKISSGLELKEEAVASLNLPVYAYIESYYRSADKTKTSKETPNTITTTPEGYLTMRAYLVLNSFDRQGITPTKIVIHDTKTSSVQETFAELQTGLKNYNYVIDKTGEIYQFAPETKRTRNSGCTKGTTATGAVAQGTPTPNTCIIEGTDDDSISIALVNLPSSATHTSSQINSLIKLIADVSSRNPTIEIKEGSIVLNSEIDSSRKNDPAQDITARKADIIAKAVAQKNGLVTQPTSASASGNLNGAPQFLVGEDGTITTPTKSIQGYVVYDEKGNQIIENPDAGQNSKNDVSNDSAKSKNNKSEKAMTDMLTGSSIIQITGRAVAPPDVNNANCFNNIRTTLYYTPDSADHGGIWSSHADPCPNSYGYCCIPEGDRGFYEDVMCQGSGVAGGQVYHYTKISADGLSQSTPLADYKSGITSTGKDPVAHRTVAADPNCPGFSYGSKLYIYWGENNPWNGYYVVEDTGSAFKGRCDKMDIYAGVGKAQLDAAAKYVGDHGKVCVLDKNFEMPDPDFSGSSTFVDPTTGEYTVPYGHDVVVKGITTLFDNTKKVLSDMIANCGKKKTPAEKETCIAGEMNGAGTKYNLDVKYCDASVQQRIWTTTEVSNDIPLIVSQFEKSYKIMGTITQVNANNMDLFAAFTAPAQPQAQQIPLVQQQTNQNSLLSKLTQTPTSAIVTITDESGTELKVNLSGAAIEWIDYFNRDSSLYESNAFLKPGSKVMMNVTKVRNSTFEGYIITKFGAISEYPKEILNEEMIKIAKTIAECTTSATACICTTEPSRMLGYINMTGTEISSVTNPDAMINVLFTMAYETYMNTAGSNKFVVNGNFVREVKSKEEENAAGQCVPMKKYIYICSTSLNNPDLGTIGYTLKI